MAVAFKMKFLLLTASLVITHRSYFAPSRLRLGLCNTGTALWMCCTYGWADLSAVGIVQLVAHETGKFILFVNGGYAAVHK